MTVFKIALANDSFPAAVALALPEMAAVIFAVISKDSQLAKALPYPVFAWRL